MTERANTCCFTGHRPERLPWLDEPGDVRSQALRQALWERIRLACEQGCTCFLSGMARGVDLLCAELVLELRQTVPEVQLIPVIPYPAQAARWPAAEQARYHAVLRACGQELVVVCPNYERGCYRKRNQYLVNHSCRIIAVYDGRPGGGTHQTLEYARRAGLRMEVLAAEQGGEEREKRKR